MYKNMQKKRGYEEVAATHYSMTDMPVSVLQSLIIELSLQTSINHRCTSKLVGNHNKIQRIQGLKKNVFHEWNKWNTVQFWINNIQRGNVFNSVSQKTGTQQNMSEINVLLIIFCNESICLSKVNVAARGELTFQMSISQTTTFIPPEPNLPSRGTHSWNG